MSSTSSLAASAPYVEVMNVKRWHSRNNHARLLRASLRFGGEAALLVAVCTRGFPGEDAQRREAAGAGKATLGGAEGVEHSAARDPVRPRATPCGPAAPPPAVCHRDRGSAGVQNRAKLSSRRLHLRQPGCRAGRRAGRGSGTEVVRGQGRPQERGRRGGRGASQRRPRGRREAGRRRGTGCRGAVGS